MLSQLFKGLIANLMRDHFSLSYPYSATNSIWNGSLPNRWAIRCEIEADFTADLWAITAPKAPALPTILSPKTRQHRDSVMLNNVCSPQRNEDDSQACDSRLVWQFASHPRRSSDVNTFSNFRSYACEYNFISSGRYGSCNGTEAGAELWLAEADIPHGRCFLEAVMDK